jgi:Endodeoxyribonuclease RusA
MISLEIQGLPPTTNNAFFSGYDGNARMVRHLTREAMAFKTLVQQKVLYGRVKPIQGQVQVSLIFYSEKWFTKAGIPRRIDVANLEKLFVDAVFEQLGMDDSCIFSLNLHKRPGPELSVIKIQPLVMPQ